MTIDVNQLLTDLTTITITNPADVRAIDRARTSGHITHQAADRLSRRYLGVPIGTPAATNSAWMERAACADHPHTWWVPTSESGWSGLWRTEEAVKAKTICASCPVAEPCLEYAVRLGIDDGIFGGLDPQQRKRWAARNGEPRHGTTTGYTADGCRCGACRDAMAEAKRRSVERQKASR